MRTRILAALALLAAATFGCAGFSVDTDYDPKFDFSGARTWQWAQNSTNIVGDDPRLRSGLLHERVRDALKQELAARGLVQRESGADLWVAYHLAIDKKIDVETTYTNQPTGRGVFVGVPDVEVREYELGTILVDLLHAADGRLVWRGSVQARLHQLKDPQERDARVRAAISALMKKYPPAPASS